MGSGVRDAGPLGGPHVRSIVMEHAAGSMSLQHVRHGSPRRAPVSVAMARVSGHGATQEDASHDPLVDPRRTPNLALCASIPVAVEPIRTLLLVLLLDSTNSGIAGGHELDGHPVWAGLKQIR